MWHLANNIICSTNRACDERRDHLMDGEQMRPTSTTHMPGRARRGRGGSGGGGANQSRHMWWWLSGNLGMEAAGERSSPESSVVWATAREWTASARVQQCPDGSAPVRHLRRIFSEGVHSTSFRTSKLEQSRSRRRLLNQTQDGSTSEHAVAYSHLQALTSTPHNLVACLSCSLVIKFFVKKILCIMFCFVFRTLEIN
jgi:hypothetical protein